MNRTALLIVATAGFVGTVVAANYATTTWGMVSVGFGLTATAGTYFAGLSFVLRDAVQDTGGRWAAVVAIAVGALLSYAVAAPAIATASAAAFAIAEAVDLAIYTPLRRRGYIRAAVASNLAGSVVDTLVFLWIAGFGLTTAALSGQVLAKMTVTAAVVALVWGFRRDRSAPRLPA